MIQKQGKNISRREFLKTSMLATAGAILASCAPAATQAPTEIPKVSATLAPTTATAVTIKPLVTNGAQFAIYLKSCGEDYTKEHPEVTFEWNSMEGGAFQSMQLPLIQGDDPPDFTWINYGSGLTDKMVQANAIENLDRYYEKYGWWKIMPDHLHTHEYNGSMYHFSCSSVTVPLLWHNKPTLEKVGGAPTDKNGLYSWADACHALNLEPLAMGDRDAWPGFHMYQAIATRTVPLADYEKILHFDKEEYYMKDYPGFAEAFQIMSDMYTKNVWAKGVMDMDDNAALQLMLDGKAVAYETGSWAIGAMRKVVGEGLDFFLFPQLHADITPPATASYADEFVLSTKSKVKDQVADFFNYVFSKAGQTHVAATGSLPIRTDMTAADMGDKADPLMGKVAELFNGSRPVTDEIVTFWPSELYALLRTDTQAAILGQKTPDEIVKEFDDLAAQFRAQK